MHAKTLVELNVRAAFGCNVMAIKRGAEMIVSPKADQLIEQDDLLIVLGADEDIKRFEQMFDDTK
jgi:trk system potassium uptake protein TrkA